MSILLIIGTFEAFFLTFLVLAMKNKTKADFFLGLIFLVVGLSIGLAYLQYYNISNGFPMPWALNISFIFMFLHGPALWFYIRSLSVRGLRFKPVYLLHFLPFLIFLLIQYRSFMILDPTEKIRIVLSESFKEGIFYKISVRCIGISTICYYLWGLKQVSDHRRNLKKYFSRIDDKDLNWLRILMIASLITYGINHLLFIFDLVFQFASFKTLMLFSYGLGSIYILVMGFFGLRQGSVFIRPDNWNPGILEKKPGKSGDYILSDSDESFIRDLKEYMEHRQPFLNPEITISGLATNLKVQPDYLSGILNGALKINFFDFINRYRVEEFKTQVVYEKNSHLSIMGIAYNCGFNSKAAFYRAFHKNENISPGDYMKGLTKK
jgi:AraC-like DNA-binding protein